MWRALKLGFSEVAGNLWRLMILTLLLSDKKCLSAVDKRRKKSLQYTLQAENTASCY
ncbi:hypothetical protein E6C60_3562 [Paenibacillus algicola]|uniref:Uncharacterized protein n=1 Tax=Paenibacillus algicola TaxID=2565926 RepID=A0A4P8XN61_9BACL|nr:hypothetical protein E6C60_3562 [Paenibacillus algicola]